MKNLLKYLGIGLFLVFVLSNKEAISQIDQFLKVKIVDYSGGQVSKNYADQLTNNQGALIQNAIINVKGQISSRLGQGLFNVDTNSAAFSGVGDYYYQSGSSITPFMVTASGTSVIDSQSNSTSWTVINTGHNITTGHNVEFIQANNLLFMINGFDNTSWWDGTTWHVGGTYPGTASPPTASTGAWLSGYLFLGGNPTNQQYLYFSDNTNPISFSTANNVINVSVGDGQPIEKVQPYRTGDLIIYKSQSIYDLNIVSNGNTTCTPQPGCTWTLTPLTQDVGTLSPRSVVSLGNDQWFLSGPPFGIRSVIRSQFDKTFVNLVSQPIQDIFDGTNINGQILNTAQVGKAAGVYFDNKYILAIPLTGSTVNNLVLVYDFITQSWYEITGWYPAEWVVYNYNLYYIDANDGRVVQCFTGTVGDIGTVIPSTSMPTVGTDFVYVSKVFDFDDAEDPKTLDNLLLEFAPTGNYPVTVSVNLDNTGWQNAGTILLTSKAITLPVQLPFTLASPGITYQVLQLTKFGKFWKIQVKVELNAVNQQVTLQKISLYATKLPFERERN
jgi:hypothetical protein